MLVKITRRGDSHFAHQVQVINTFGQAQLAQVCCQAVLADYSARTEFDEQTLAQARKIEQEGVPLSELSDRMDLTGMDIFTIDSADSKDLDDAVSLERDEDHWYLGVHIADVSHYVRQGSPLDLEAYRRGTSVYYADQVIPMLPKELSNGICSLNPDEVRLTFSALITLKPSGEIEGFRFVKSYIRSRVKGVYSEINSILDQTASPQILEKYAQLIPQIKWMQQLAQILRARRFDRGAMNISSNESKFVIENGRIKDILPRPTGESERMIEEFMLTANQAAATLAMEQELPFIYRVHEQPPVIKINLLHDLLTRLNLPAQRLLENPQPKDFSDILEGVRGTELEPAINGQLLRTMSKAIYSEKNIGHFGLVLDNYALHFAYSPLSRPCHPPHPEQLSGRKPEGKAQKEIWQLCAGSQQKCKSDGAERHEHRTRLRGLLQGGVYVRLYRTKLYRQNHWCDLLWLLCRAGKQRRGLGFHQRPACGRLPAGGRNRAEGQPERKFLPHRSVAAGDSGFGGCFCRTGQLYTGIKIAGLL